MKHIIVFVGSLFAVTLIQMDAVANCTHPMGATEQVRCRQEELLTPEERAERARALGALTEAEEAIRRDPRASRIVASAAVCAFKTIRKRALEEIREQRAYARVGGVTNRYAIWQLQESVRYADKGLRKYGKNAGLACASEDVLPLAACFSQYPDEDTGPCEENKVKVYATVFPDTMSL